MINVSIRALCSYTWHKNRSKNASTVMNILKCIGALAYAGLFCSWKVKLSEVEAVYNQNNNNTIFGKEYRKYNSRFDQRKIEKQHSVEVEVEEKKDMNMVSIACLSNELTVRIFSRLDQDSIYACRNVSKSWKQLVDDHYLVCRVFSFNFNPLIGRPNRQEAVDQYGSSTRKKLKNFSVNGAKLVEKLDRLLMNKFFPDILSFSTNKLLVCSEVFLCKEIAEIQPLYRVQNASFSSDGHYLVTASYDYTAQIWKLVDGELHQKVTIQHSDWVVNASFSPDGHYLVTASHDHTAQIWKLVDGEWHQKVTIKHFNWVNNASFSSDGNCLVTASGDKTAQVWKLVDEKWQKTATIKHNGSIKNAHFSPDGHYLVTASYDRTAKIWELVDEKWQEIVIIKHNKTVANAIFSSNGNYLVTASYDKTAEIWMLVKKEESIEDDASVSSARFNLSENQLVAAPDDGVAETRKLVTAPDDGVAETRKIVKNEKEWKKILVINHDRYVNNVSFSPDGNYLVTASNDNTAEIWELVENKWHREAIIEHDDWVLDANFNPHGTHLVTVSLDGSSKVWGRNVHKKWQEKATIYHSFYHFVMINSANFSSDGMNVVTASREGVKIWQVEGEQKSNVS